LYQDYIRQSGKTDRASLNISEVDVIRDKRKPTSMAVDVSVEDRYYTKQEYAKLGPEQRKILLQRRAARGHKPKVKGSKTAPPKGASFTKKDIQKLVISAVKKQIAGKPKDDDDASMKSETSDIIPVGSANRSNAALSRKK
jgi:hypothetical protein